MVTIIRDFMVIDIHDINLIHKIYLILFLIQNLNIIKL